MELEEDEKHGECWCWCGLEGSDAGVRPAVDRAPWAQVPLRLVLFILGDDGCCSHPGGPRGTPTLEVRCELFRR